jgi:hypothetical protein
MENQDTDKLKEQFEQASKIASVVPEAMQPEAFNRALEALQGNQKVSPKSKIDQSNPRSSRTNDRQSDDDWWQQIDASQYHAVFDAPNTRHRVLEVLKLARDDFNVDYLTPIQISTILLKKFKISMETKHVSARLGEMMRYINRQPDGKGYKYALMHAGDKFLTGEIKDQAKPKAATKKTANKKGSATKNPVGEKKSVKKSSRPGPKGIVEQLIKDGFFNQPKLIQEISKHVSKTMGYTLKNTDLSPALVRLVRSQQLDRDENENGQYEYKKK